MNSKILVSAVAVLMLLAGAVAYISMPNDAAGSDGSNENDAIDLGRVIVEESGGSPSNVIMKYNYSAYDKIYYSVDPTVYVAEKPGTGTTVSSDWTKIESTSTSALGFSIKVSNTEGDVKIEISGDSSSSSKDLLFKLVVTVTPVSGATPIELNSIYYGLKVDVRSVGAIPDMTASIDSGKDGVFNVTFGGTTDTFDVFDYTYWYAIGLPSGLNLNVDGSELKLSGLVPSSDIDTIEAKVVARDNDGNEVVGKLTITINEGTGITYTMKDGDTVLSPTADGYYYTTQNNDDITLVMGGVDSDDVKIAVIKMDDTDLKRLNVVASPVGTYEIPTTGVGEYVIEISGPSGVKEILLSIIPVATGSGAGLILVGN